MTNIKSYVKIYKKNTAWKSATAPGGMGVQGYTLLGGHWPDGNVAGAQKPLQTNVMQIPSYGCMLPSINCCCFNSAVPSL